MQECFNKREETFYEPFEHEGVIPIRAKKEHFDILIKIITSYSKHKKDELEAGIRPPSDENIVKPISHPNNKQKENPTIYFFEDSYEYKIKYYH